MKKNNNEAVETIFEGETQLDLGTESIDNILFKDFQKRLEQLDLEDEDMDIDSSEQLTLENAVRDFQNGESEAFDYIFGQYKPKLDRLAYRKNDDELAQELSIVLMHAVERFDATANVKFNTFFWTCAQNHMGTQKIRKNAQKRSGAKKVEVTAINPETGLEETFVEIVKTKVVSLQATMNAKDSEVEVGAFIESTSFKNQFDDSELMICLRELHETGQIKEKEMKAIMMIMDGSTLAEVGQELGGVTAPAIHVMLRRLGQRKGVQKHLLEILS